MTSQRPQPTQARQTEVGRAQSAMVSGGLDLLWLGEGGGRCRSSASMVSEMSGFYPALSSVAAPAKGLTCSFRRRQSRGRVTSRMVFSCARAARRWRYRFLEAVKGSEWGGVQTHTQYLDPQSQDRNVNTNPRPAKSPGA